MINDFALIVITCDSYYGVAKYFFPILKMYWPNFDEKTYIINETNKDSYNYPLAQIINAGPDPIWTNRLEYALEHISEKYILLTMDDYYFGKHINNETFGEIIDFMIKNQIYYYCLKNKTIAKHRYFPQKHIGFIDDNKKYGISLQAAIWDKNKLLEIIRGLSCSAWEVEDLLNQRIKKKFGGPIEGCATDTRNVLNIQNAVIKGKWVPSALKFYKKQGLIIDTGNRGLLSKKEILRQKIFTIFSRKMPNALSYFLKKILKKIGFKFVTK